METPGITELAIPDQRYRQVGKDGSAVLLLAMRRVQLKIDRELKHAERERGVRRARAVGASCINAAKAVKALDSPPSAYSPSGVSIIFTILGRDFD